MALQRDEAEQIFVSKKKKKRSYDPYGFNWLLRRKKNKNCAVKNNINFIRKLLILDRRKKKPFLKYDISFMI